jgi:alkyl hydroperoxide reductase subunit D
MHDLISNLPDYAKDIKLNIKTIIDGIDNLSITATQAKMVLLTCAVTTKNKSLITAIQSFVIDLSDQSKNAAMGAATIMGMNNIYYRTTHLLENQEYSKMPAGLRMNIIANHGVDKVDFEMCELAASAINGCVACVNAHESACRAAGLDASQVQQVIKIAAIIYALSVAV